MAGDETNLLDEMLAEAGPVEIRADDHRELRPEARHRPAPPAPEPPAEVAGMSPGTRFELRGGGVESDGLWVVIRVEARAHEASRRSVSASRTPEGLPPFLQLGEPALLDALRRGQIRLIDQVTLPPTAAQMKAETRAAFESQVPAEVRRPSTPVPAAAPALKSWTKLLPLLTRLSLFPAYRDERSLQNDLAKRLAIALGDDGEVKASAQLTGRDAVTCFGPHAPDLLVRFTGAEPVAMVARQHADGPAEPIILAALTAALPLRARYDHVVVVIYTAGRAYPPALGPAEDRLKEDVLSAMGVHLVLMDAGLR